MVHSAHANCNPKYALFCYMRCYNVGYIHGGKKFRCSVILFWNRSCLYPWTLANTATTTAVRHSPWPCDSTFTGSHFNFHNTERVVICGYHQTGYAYSMATMYGHLTGRPTDSDLDYILNYASDNDSVGNTIPKIHDAGLNARAGSNFNASLVVPAR